MDNEEFGVIDTAVLKRFLLSRVIPVLPHFSMFNKPVNIHLHYCTDEGRTMIWFGHNIEQHPTLLLGPQLPEIR